MFLRFLSRLRVSINLSEPKNITECPRALARPSPPPPAASYIIEHVSCILQKGAH